jgi:hypothetical protein
VLRKTLTRFFIFGETKIKETFENEQFEKQIIRFYFFTHLNSKLKDT